MRQIAPLLVFLAFIGGSSVKAQEANLIEYSYGAFAEGFEFGGPMLLPPKVKIYQSGRVVFWNSRGIWTGQIEERRLEKLRRTLARSELLRESRILPVKRGRSLGMHGGMAYLRYLEGGEQVLVAVMSLPRRGPWQRLVGLLSSYIPSSYRSFLPNSALVRIRSGGSWQDPVPWPFEEELSLARAVGSEEMLSDPRMISFVLAHLSPGFSWLEVIVSEKGREFSLSLQAVPGWYDPDDTEMTLGLMAGEQLETDNTKN